LFDNASATDSTDKSIYESAYDKAQVDLDSLVYLAGTIPNLENIVA